MLRLTKIILLFFSAFLLFGFLGAMLKLYRSTSVGPICSYASGEVLIVSIMYVFVRIDRAVVLMLNIFLVEFEPYGYLYVLVGDELNKVFGWLGFRTSMYRLSNSTITRTWSPYTLNSTTSEQEWILDEDGNKIVYDRSPFYVANAGNAKYYLLENEDGYYIPAIKTGEDFVNLISGEKFPFQSGQPETAQACECIYFIGKKYFDL